jgi:hypothetical protein
MIVALKGQDKPGDQQLSCPFRAEHFSIGANPGRRSLRSLCPGLICASPSGMKTCGRRPGTHKPEKFAADPARHTYKHEDHNG